MNTRSLLLKAARATTVRATPATAATTTAAATQALIRAPRRAVATAGAAGFMPAAAGIAGNLGTRRVSLRPPAEMAMAAAHTARTVHHT